MIKNIIIIALFGLFNCGKRSNFEPIQEEPKQLVNDSIVYSFLNFILSPQSVMHSFCKVVAYGDDEVVEFLNSDSIMVEYKGNLLSIDDILFIKDQTRSLTYFKLKPELLPNKQLVPTAMLKKLWEIPNDTTPIWQTFRNEFKTRGYCTVTIPLFSRDMSIAIIDIGFHCGGLCGTGGIYVYKKEMGKWELNKILQQWIS